MKRDFQKMFLDVDGPLAIEMAEILSSLSNESPHEQHEQVALLCHRIRGDARTVGFTIIGDLTGIIEEALPMRNASHSLEPARWPRLMSDIPASTRGEIAP